MSPIHMALRIKFGSSSADFEVTIMSPRNSKSGYQLIQNNWGGMFSLSSG